jgi:hypothetical protein
MLDDKPKPPKVEREKSEDEKRHYTFTRMAIKSVAELRKHLDSNSAPNPRFYAPYVRKARDYVISGMMNEVEKAALSAMQTSDFILRSQNDNGTAVTEEMKKEMPLLEPHIYESRIDEMVLWERKMTEQLVNVIGFKHVRKDEYYRHYIVLGEVERLSKISSDFYQYHGAKNKNIEHQLIELRASADGIATGLDPTKCWYVNSINSTKKAKYEIASYKQRLDRVLPWMTPNQKLMVGKSYGEYSVQSSSLHPGQAKIKDEVPTMKALDNHFMRVTMLAAEVVMGAKDAMSMHNKKGWLGDMSKAYKGNTYPATLMAKLTKPGIDVGDFVIAHSDLAEVVKVIKSRFGYSSFRVRYLETPPIPSIPVDEMPAQYVQLYSKRKPTVDAARKLLVEEGSPKPSTRRLNEAARKTIIDFWSIQGGKEIAFGDPNAGYKKMGEYLEEQKNKSNSR